ncbi:MAG TPA: c-type cytochrome biogenesis protein CcsB [Candidatus Omnitrophota bacterium]|nr:c-type cytochrome biogenesis protein CcsB [Candidatus Omnitrophota bacterium]
MQLYYERLFILTCILYSASAAGYALYFLTQRPRVHAAGFWTGTAGLLMHTVILIARGLNSRGLPLSGLYESLSFFAWSIMLIYVLTERRSRSPVNGIFVLPLVNLLMFSALRMDNAVHPLPPALQSPWLGVHVSLCFLGYACFVLAFCFAVMYLWQESEVKSRKVDGFFFRLPSLELLDNLGYRSIVFGFIFLTLGIISGSFWAQKAWGRFWSWDPKETWSLILWLVYVVYLHGRLMRGWHGKKSAYLAIIGFMAMVFTYLGVNFLLPGLHSYLR